MKKRIALAFMTGFCVAALAACGGTKAAKVETDTAAASETAATETEAETETEAYYAYNYDLDQLVSLGDYKGLTYTIADTSVTEEEIDTEIGYKLKEYEAPEQITDRAAEDGDTVNIDFEGKMDGEAFNGGSAEGYTLVLGSGSFIDGFEDGLVGVKPGEKVTLDLKFPDEYPNNPDFAGKDVAFDVTLNYIHGETITPELNDEFVVSLGLDDVKTVDAYREYVRGYLTEGKISDAESSMRNELVEKAVANAQVKELPEDLVEQYKNEYTSYYSEYAQYFGMELEDFLTQYMNNMTVEDLEKEARTYGEDAAKHMLVICAIARAEGLDNTDEGYDEKLADYAEQNNFDSVETFEETYGKEYLKQVIINERVFDFLADNATGVEADETETETETAEN